MRTTPLLILAAAVASGCAGQDFSRNLYEGIRLYNESQRGTPREGPPGPALTYEQYERERRASAQTP